MEILLDIDAMYGGFWQGFLLVSVAGLAALGFCLMLNLYSDFTK